MKKTTFAFTLVELVIVIVILGVLSSIGFVSYSNYIAGSRDANRVSQIRDIYKGLQLYGTNKKLPYPDNYVTITASGTTVGYQGYAGADTLKTIGYSNGGQDPKDKTYFTYSLSKDRKELQVLGFLEEKDNLETQVAQLPITQVSAANYIGRYPKSTGSELGIILQKTTQNPVQETTSGIFDVNISTSNTHEIVFSDSQIFSAAGLTAYSIINPILDPSLQIYYNLEDFIEENGIQKVKDLSGKGNHGTPQGNIEFINGHAEDNHPTTRTSRIETPYVINFSTSDYTFVAMSYEKSVRPVVNYGAVFGHGPGSLELMLFYGYSLLTNYYYLGSGWSVGSTGPRIVDTWQHFAGTIEKNGNTQIFQNGVARTAVDIGDFPNSSINLQAMCYGNANYCLDKIDEIRVYNRKLTSEEIQLLYKETSKNY